MADTTAPATGAMQDILTLAELARQEWDQRLDALRASGVPLNADGDAGGGAGTGDGGDEQGTGGSDASSGDGAGSSDDAALGDAGKAALAQERKARREAEKSAREAQARIEEFEARDMTEQQKLEKRAAEAEGRLTPLEQENARLKVALAKGLTGDKAFLADRLRGNTEEELTADADELIKQFGGGTQRGSGFDGGARGSAPITDMDTLIRQNAGFG